METTTDPQMVIPGLADAIDLYEELGRRHEATELVDRLLGFSSQPEIGSRPWMFLSFVCAARLLGRTDDARRLVQRASADNLWRKLEEAILDERYLEAADQFAEIDWATDEAWARRKAAEQLLAAGRTAEAVTQLERALSFARAVRATRDIQRCEALLAQTRDAAG
jgi:tetratricopeptide (TPR) repeat protein